MLGKIVLGFLVLVMMTWVVGLIHDISEEKRKEERFFERERQAEQEEIDEYN